VMETTPLVGGFKELPSQAEINVVTEKQQAMIREGKIEVLGVEVVATGEDGDLLVALLEKDLNLVPEVMG